ncbi:P-loop containing nucleoside triphosphate hydrolase protein [Cubamyces sp. BRFM 1775]|nr:P-loop containing nucleoside triphosphate hydrolase protein [Cubamyces sp. BRFM 1775]
MVALIDQVCPEQLFAGGCTRPNCPLNHNVKFCDICCAICTPVKTWPTHIQGRQHRTKAAQGNSTTVLCPICIVRLSGESTWLDHIGSASHTAKAQQLGKSSSVYPRDASKSDHNYCLVCRRSIPTSAWKAHLRAGGHRKAQDGALYRARFEQAERDRGGVHVSHEEGLDFGILSLEDAQRGRQSQIEVRVVARSNPLAIAKLETFAGSSRKPSAFSASASVHGQHITPKRPAQVAIRFSQHNRGRYDGRLEVTLKDTVTQRTFVILRQLCAVVGNPADHQLLRPKAPYVRRGRAPWRQGGAVVDGERPPALDAVKWVKKLPPSRIPGPLAAIIANGSMRDIIVQTREQFLPPTLHADTHGTHFRVLLWIEEARMVEDLHMYDIEGARFTKEGRLYTLPVPGLAEKRPSVAPGDTILAQQADGRTHRGFVHFVRRDDIRVHFHSSFNSGSSYNIQFQYNRTPIQRQHQALLAPCTSSQRLLFPLPGYEGLSQAIAPAGLPQITLFNAQIATNAAQLQAVKSILRLRTGSAPFIVFGPPGTGKTVTIVEAIKQVLHLKPDARILACAPSNSAADLIAQRLDALDTTQLFRCNAVFRDIQSLPGELAAYSLYRDNHFVLPPVETLQRYKVVVTTCGNSSFAYNIGMPNGHFTHIFIDEAGQASEPEVLTAIKAIAAPGTQVILSGDPKQLGPVIRSSIAREFGLGQSYLERLMERPVYDPHNGRGRSYIKLVKNFRSHEAILAYPNAQFYGGELEVCGSPTVINSFLGSPMLVNQRWPVVFHYVSGENERESTSPSYFNIEEATEVLEYIKQLLRDRQHPIRAADIGVIAPYYAQVRKIRLLLRRDNIEDVKVGSVEEFQGQERRVIIISTVRSTRDLLSYDAKFTLGFVSNPRRFNVAVTRAQALLVVIGDASVLSIDPLWRSFMNYIHLHGGWRGDAPTWDVNAPVQMDGNYAAEIREDATADMDALLARLDQGEDLEGEANVDHAFQEAN